MKLKCDAQQFVRGLKACSHAAGNDAFRPHLSGVWVRTLPSGLAHMYATNGHWLAVCRIEPEEFEPGLVRIDRKDIRLVLGAAPPRSLLSKEGATISVVGKQLNVVFSGGSGVALENYECTSPPIQDVVPRGKSPKKHKRPTLNIALVRGACDAIADMVGSKTKLAGLRLVATGATELDPQIVWSPQAKGFFALLMPMRGEETRDMSWWEEQALELVEMAKAAKAAANQEQAHAAE